MTLLTVWMELDVSALPAGARVHALAGIGRPERFFGALARNGMDVASRTARPDHAPFAPGEVERLAEEAARDGAALVTTEKDWVRMSEAAREAAVAVPARMACVEPALLRSLLAPLFGGRAT
jgi:tetraacyldisaccharide 4'-kinase